MAGDYFFPVVNVINILRAAFAPIFLRQKLQSQTVISEKLGKVLLYDKGVRKMLLIISFLGGITVEAA